MIKSPLSIVGLVFFSFMLWKSAVAGNPERRVFEYQDNRGGVHDFCLNNHVPISMKKNGKNLYFVKVRNRFVGNVIAGSYGEARDIACSKKTDLILYNSDP